MIQGNCALNCALPNPLNLLLVDDHQLFLDGLVLTLQKLEVGVHIERAANGAEAQQRLSQRKDFHLILLDLSLPDMPGLSFLTELSQTNLFIPIAILSASEEVADVTRALACGATGYISKAAESEQILEAIRSILCGRTSLPDFYERATRHAHSPACEEGLNPDAITPRQMQVLQLLAQGLPNKRICQQLNLTEDTVKTHLKALFTHLKVHNRTECVAVASRLSLLTTS